jgi:hypothetical protein
MKKYIIATKDNNPQKYVNEDGQYRSHIDKAAIFQFRNDSEAKKNIWIQQNEKLIEVKIIKVKDL